MIQTRSQHARYVMRVRLWDNCKTNGATRTFCPARFGRCVERSKYMVTRSYAPLTKICSMNWSSPPALFGQFLCINKNCRKKKNQHKFSRSTGFAVFFHFYVVRIWFYLQHRIDNFQITLAILMNMVYTANFSIVE